MAWGWTRTLSLSFRCCTSQGIDWQCNPPSHFSIFLCRCPCLLRRVDSRSANEDGVTKSTTERVPTSLPLAGSRCEGKDSQARRSPSSRRCGHSPPLPPQGLPQGVDWHPDRQVYTPTTRSLQQCFLGRFARRWCGATSFFASSFRGVALSVGRGRRGKKCVAVAGAGCTATWHAHQGDSAEPFGDKGRMSRSRCTAAGVWARAREGRGNWQELETRVVDEVVGRVLNGAAPDGLHLEQRANKATEEREKA